MSKIIATATLAAALATTALVGDAMALPVTGLLSNNSLVNFDSATPGSTSTVAIQGLGTGETVRGIDFRPADRQLYGVISQRDGSAARVVTINPLSGVTNSIAGIAQGAGNAPTGAPGAAIGIRGGLVGVDFNPMADLLRVVTDAEQNLRINPGNRAAGGPAGSTAIDGDLNFNGLTEPALNIASAAYSNNIAGATSTFLYTLDTATDQLFVQAPPNAGTQTTGAGVGAADERTLGRNAVGSAGFDIAVGTVNVAFASFKEDSLNSLANLYSIQLSTGDATLIGQIGGQSLTGGVFVTDMAVTPIPAPLALLGSAIVGLGLVRNKMRRNARTAAA